MIRLKATVIKARIEERDYTDPETQVKKHFKNLRVTVLDSDGDPAELIFREERIPQDWDKVLAKGKPVDVGLSSLELPKGSSIPLCRAAANE